LSSGPNGELRPIGVVGVGLVGATVSGALSGAGFPVRRYDLYRGIGRPADLAPCSMVFVCVPTPRGDDGGLDTSEVFDAVSRIAPHLGDGTPVAIKSTVPPGTCDRLGEMFPRLALCSVPEFLVAEQAAHTFRRPDRIVIGAPSQSAAQTIVGVLSRVAPEAPVLHLLPIESELVKLAANAMLAAKVSLANELGEICDRFGVQWADVEAAVGMDHRIAPGHLTVTGQRGFGGGCLPKDLDGLIEASRATGYEPGILTRIADFNRSIRRVLALATVNNPVQRAEVETTMEDEEGTA
jgi:UDPglucose 6-dehydrogenase